MRFPLQAPTRFDGLLLLVRSWFIRLQRRSHLNLRLLHLIQQFGFGIGNDNCGSTASSLCFFQIESSSGAGYFIDNQRGNNIVDSSRI